MNPQEIKTLGDEIELAYGYSLPAHSRESGDVPVFGSNGQVGWHNQASVDGPGIIIGRKGSVGEVTYSPVPFFPIDTTYYVVNKYKHHWKYLYYTLQHAGLTTLNSHSAIPGLNREDAYALSAYFPVKSEQKNIADSLSLIEMCLEYENSSVKLSQRLKHATMHKLFTCGLRGEPQKETEIGLVPESWEVVPFSDIRQWLQYGTSTRCTERQLRYPVLRIPNIEIGKVLTEPLKYCDLDETVASRYVLESGDLLFIRTNGVVERLGSCAVYEGAPQNALFASYLIRAHLKDGVIPRFVAFYFGSETGSNLVKDRATPAADGKYNLNTGIIDSFPVPVPPSKEEQQEIVDILDAIDQKIDLHRRKKAVLEELFKSLLHKLMTGEIRVDDLDLSALESIQPEPQGGAA